MPRLPCTNTDLRQQLLGLCASGPDEIARAVYLSPSTVKYHVTVLMEKLDRKSVV